MHKFRLVPAGVAALVSAILLASSPIVISQPAIEVSAPSLAAPDTGLAGMVVGFERADFFETSYGAGLPARVTRVSSDPLLGITLASTDPDMSPMFTPMLALYSQLLALGGSTADGISWQRLKVRMANAAVTDKTSLLAIDEVLAAELDRVELLAVDAQRLQELGIAAADVKRLPKLSVLVDTVKSAMMELPQGMSRFDGPVGVAVWGSQADKVELVSLLVRAD